MCSSDLAPCFSESNGQYVVATIDLLLPYDVNDLDNLDPWEEWLRGRMIGGHLGQWGNLSYVGTTREGGEVLQHLPLELLEDKQHLGGEDYNIPN